MNTMKKITTLYKYGFYYKDVLYAWKNKKLYKLPYIKNNRSYSLKEIPSYVFKTTVIFNIQRDKLSIKKLKERTVEVNIYLDTFVENECPF